MGKENEPTFLEKAAAQWRGFRVFLYNSEEKTVLGRGGKSWAHISLFYLVFYTCLAAFWAVMLIVFLQTISEDKPKFTSYIGTPGLYQIPQPEDKVTVITFSKGNSGTYSDYTKEMRKTYSHYKEIIEANNTDRYIDCMNNRPRPDESQREQICQFDIEEIFGDVCKPPNFGYDMGTPCIFLGINRVWGWIPENYETSKVPDNIRDTWQEDFITIGCDVYKKENTFLNRTVMAPEAGISFKYFPYLGRTNDNYKDEYVSPLVALQFHVKIDKEVRILCKSYAANIAPGGGLFDTSYQSELRLDLTVKS